jgi:PKD repeat protein
MKGYVKVVAEVPLEGRFSWFPVLVRTGEEVKFTDESLGAPTVWNWEFEGLGSKKDHNPTVAFVKPGKTKVTLAVAKEGASHSFMQEIDVLPLPPDPSFTADPPELEIGQVLNLKATKNENEWTHTWIIGGDTIKTGVETTWTADKLGRVDVQHAVKGPGGLVEKPFTVVVKEKPVALVAKFKWSPIEVRVGDKVQLVDESSGAPDAWIWDVTGLGSYQEHNPTLTFTKPGSYPVELTVTRKGIKNTIKKAISVLPRVEPVVAQFETSSSRGRTPVSVRFSDKSKGAIAQWKWDFGDGGVSDLQNPSYEYERPGTYRPRLTVTDTQGRTSKSPGDLVFEATGPLPWYWKGLIGLVAAVILWLLVVVPVAKVFILPHQGSRLITTGPNRLREKALANSSIWWPVGYVRIGGSSGDNIKLMITDPSLQNKSLAVVARIPFTRQYTVRAQQSNGVQIQIGSGSAVTRKDVKTSQLKTGSVFFVANTQFRFELS